jgi:hypothetical protein
MTDEEKKFLGVQKYYLSLKKKLAKFKAAGLNPPEYLLKNFEHAKHAMDYLAKELE